MPNTTWRELTMLLIRCTRNRFECTTNELKVIARLQEHKIYPKVLQPIPILSSGGKLEHLYLADIVVGKTIIEIDGPLHKPEYDLKRDELTAAQGYKTIRIPTSDLSVETIDSYLKELY